MNIKTDTVSKTASVYLEKPPLYNLKSQGRHFRISLGFNIYTKPENYFAANGIYPTVLTMACPSAERI